MHGILIAQPYQGHINPSVHLAIKLASKGITVTFINTEYAHHKISKSHHVYDNETEVADIFTEARASGLDIRYATIPDGLPLEFDREFNVVEYWECLMNEFPVIALEFVGKLIEESTVTPFLIADTFGSWPAKVAERYNLVNVSFWTMPATVFALDYYKNLLVENGHFPPKGICFISHFY